MQRVRIGLTGLAFVFVLVMLAAVFTRATDEQPITANGIEQAATGSDAVAANAAANAAAEAANEPLAKLGVAPGSAPEVSNEATPATVAVEDPLRPRRSR